LLKEGIIMFVFIGFNPVPAVYVKFPMSNWIYSANDDVMYHNERK